MAKDNVKLICRTVWYYTQHDEDAFFEWLKKISSIVDVEGWRDELHLYVKNRFIPDSDLYDLIAIFYRYNIKDMTQLKIFLNDENKEWFFDNPLAYWHKRVFGEPRIKLICDDAVFEDEESEERFEKNVMEISSVEELDNFGPKVHIYVKSKIISDSDLKKLIDLFEQYKIKDMAQLKLFLNDENKEWFQDKHAFWYNRVFNDGNKQK